MYANEWAQIDQRIIGTVPNAGNSEKGMLICLQ